MQALVDRGEESFVGEVEQMIRQGTIVTEDSEAKVWRYRWENEVSGQVVVGSYPFGHRQRVDIGTILRQDTTLRAIREFQPPLDRKLRDKVAALMAQTGLQARSQTTGMTVATELNLTARIAKLEADLAEMKEFLASGAGRVGGGGKKGRGKANPGVKVAKEVSSIVKGTIKGERNMGLVPRGEADIQAIVEGKAPFIGLGESGRKKIGTIGGDGRALETFGIKRKREVSQGAINFAIGGLYYGLQARGMVLNGSLSSTDKGRATLLLMERRHYSLSLLEINEEPLVARAAVRMWSKGDSLIVDGEKGVKEVRAWYDTLTREGLARMGCRSSDGELGEVGGLVEGLNGKQCMQLAGLSRFFSPHKTDLPGALKAFRERYAKVASATPEIGVVKLVAGAIRKVLIEAALRVPPHPAVTPVVRIGEREISLEEAAEETCATLSLASLNQLVPTTSYDWLDLLANSRAASGHGSSTVSTKQMGLSEDSPISLEAIEEELSRPTPFLGILMPKTDELKAPSRLFSIEPLLQRSCLILADRATAGLCRQIDLGMKGIHPDTDIYKRIEAHSKKPGSFAISLDFSEWCERFTFKNALIWSMPLQEAMGSSIPAYADRLFALASYANRSDGVIDKPRCGMQGKNQVVWHLYSRGMVRLAAERCEMKVDQIGNGDNIVVMGRGSYSRLMEEIERVATSCGHLIKPGESMGMNQAVTLSREAWVKGKHVINDAKLAATISATSDRDISAEESLRSGILSALRYASEPASVLVLSDILSEALADLSSASLEGRLTPVSLGGKRLLSIAEALVPAGVECGRSAESLLMMDQVLPASVGQDLTWKDSAKPVARVQFSTMIRVSEKFSIDISDEEKIALRSVLENDLAVAYLLSGMEWLNRVLRLARIEAEGSERKEFRKGLGPLRASRYPDWVLGIMGGAKPKFKAIPKASHGIAASSADTMKRYQEEKLLRDQSKQDVVRYGQLVEAASGRESAQELLDDNYWVSADAVRPRMSGVVKERLVHESGVVREVAWSVMRLGGKIPGVVMKLRGGPTAVSPIELKRARVWIQNANERIGEAINSDSASGLLARLKKVNLTPSAPLHYDQMGLESEESKAEIEASAFTEEEKDEMKAGKVIPSWWYEGASQALEGCLTQDKNDPSLFTADLSLAAGVKFSYRMDSEQVPLPARQAQSAAMGLAATIQLAPPGKRRAIYSRAVSAAIKTSGCDIEVPNDGSCWASALILSFVMGTGATLVDLEVTSPTLYHGWGDWYAQVAVARALGRRLHAFNEESVSIDISQALPDDARPLFIHYESPIHTTGWRFLGMTDELEELLS